jgi:hypothetical protein
MDVQVGAAGVHRVHEGRLRARRGAAVVVHECRIPGARLCHVERHIVGAARHASREAGEARQLRYDASIPGRLHRAVNVRLRDGAEQPLKTDDELKRLRLSDRS